MLAEVGSYLELTQNFSGKSVPKAFR
jgi:hypothetical protein